MNQGIVIKIENPILRPGLSIQTTTSRGYADGAADDLLEIARRINERFKQG